MNREELKKILPHREPMLLVDEAEVLPDGTARGIYRVRGDEFFLQGHFPGNPVVPGVILCEITAQSACVLFKEKMEQGVLPLYAGLNKVRFKKPVRPGDELVLTTKITCAHAPFYVIEGEASVDGQLCMRGEFMIALEALKKD